MSDATVLESIDSGVSSQTESRNSSINAPPKKVSALSIDNCYLNSSGSDSERSDRLKDPVVESSLALRKISDAFGKFAFLCSLKLVCVVNRISFLQKKQTASV